MRDQGHLVSLFPVCCATGVAFAQDIAGSLEGRVIDAEGWLLANVHVAAAGSGLLGTRVTQTDDRGRFQLRDLPVGPYTVVFRRIGYRELGPEDVRVYLGRTTSLGTIALEGASLRS